MNTPARFLAPDSRLQTRARIRASLTPAQKSNAARWIVTAAVVFIVTVVLLRAWFA